MASQTYHLRETREADAADLNRLYKRVTGRDRTLAQYHWEWRDGPLGPAASFVILCGDDEAVVGHHGIVPVPLSIGTRDLRGGRTENTMVDPAHRGKFVYSAFEARVAKQLRGRFDAIFTTAGGGAPGAIRRRLGYIEIGKWNAFTPIAPPAYLLARLTGLGGAAAALAWLTGGVAPRGADLVDTEDADAIAALWTNWRSAYPLAPARDAAYLRWRVYRHPYTRYRSAIASRDGEAFGAVIWRERFAPEGWRDIAIEDIFVRGRREELYADVLRTIGGRDRDRPTRVTVRTLDDEGPLARAARHLAPFWSARRGLGSPLLARFADPDLAATPWAATMLLGQGI